MLFLCNHLFSPVLFVYLLQWNKQRSSPTDTFDAASPGGHSYTAGGFHWRLGDNAEGAKMQLVFLSSSVSVGLFGRNVSGSENVKLGKVPLCSYLCRGTHQLAVPHSKRLRWGFRWSKGKSYIIPKSSDFICIMIQIVSPLYPIDR